LARSLTIKREENASTSPLFTGFLVIAVAWMLLSALFGGSADAAVSPIASAPLNLLIP
jgi:hypothetical protein